MRSAHECPWRWTDHRLDVHSHHRRSRRFARCEDVGAYSGLAPRRSQSGERDVRGNISKAGDPMLRRSLYEAANIMLCRVQRPFALQQWSHRAGEQPHGAPTTSFV
ncbi:MAG: IS110 family transposase [Sphingomonadales bacterium]|nr:IS110 family transposase [Sphingomonadales bacterium]